MIKIIPVDEQHIESLYRCLDAVARERRFLAFVEAPPLPAVQQFVQAIVESGAVQVLAVEGDTVVGWCDVLSRPMEGFTHVGALGMGIAASHRRRGIGQQLVSAAVERSRAAGLERVELEVFASNRPAVTLYKKLGFAQEGVKRRARKIDGAYDDIILMALTL